MKNIKSFESYGENEPYTYPFKDATGEKLVKDENYTYKGKVTADSKTVVTDDDRVREVSVKLIKCNKESCYFEVMDNDVKEKHPKIVINNLDMNPKKTQKLIFPKY